MTRHAIYSVVGVRANGERVVIAEGVTRGDAETVVGLMQPGSTFKTVVIEETASGTPLRIFDEPAPDA